MTKMCHLQDATTQPAIITLEKDLKGLQRKRKNERGYKLKPKHFRS